MRTIGLASLLALAACAPARPAAPSSPDAPPAPLPPPGEDTCGARASQNLIGKSDTVVTGRTRSGEEAARTYRMGDPVTMDFRPNRLNVETDAAGRIVRLSCG